MRNFIKSTSWLLFASLLVIGCGSSNEKLITPKSSVKNLSNLTVNGTKVVSSTYEESTSTYYLLIPTGTDLHAIDLDFSLPAEASAKPISGTIQDFTKPIIYTITAADGSTKSFTIKMTF